jgi:hypothetical protein
MVRGSIPPEGCLPDGEIDMDPVHTNFDAEEFAKVKAVGRGERTKMAGSFCPRRCVNAR